MSPPAIGPRRDPPRYVTTRERTGSVGRTGAEGNASINRLRSGERTGGRGAEPTAVQTGGRRIAGTSTQGTVGVERRVGNENASVAVAARANGSAGAQITSRGASAQASGDVFVGAEARAQGRVGAARGEAEARAGAMASGNARGSIGRNGAAVEVGGEAFVGARASANGRVEGRHGSAGVGVEGYAGAGVTGSVRGSFTTDRVGFRFKVGASLGLGGAISGEVSINPRAIVNDVAGAGRSALNAGKDLVGGIGRRLGF